MDIKKLDAFIKLAKDSEVNELTYENGDEKYSVKLGGGTPVYAAPSMPVSAHAATPSASPAAKVDDGLLEVTSPFVGTFYRSSSPESAAYVKQGDSISSGKVLCIVEAMKIMNEIESEVSGEVVEICVENETYVEFGQVLFKVKP